jgi:hypothetical protein
VTDDGQEFADSCLQLLDNDKLWLEKRDAALAHVESFCAPSRLHAAIDTLLSEVPKKALMTVHLGTDLSVDGRGRTIDLNQWRDEITL